MSKDSKWINQCLYFNKTWITLTQGGSHMLAPKQKQLIH